jgi:hypothetical protein
MVKGSCLISGELSGSRLTRFELGGAARAVLHAAHIIFRFPWGQGLHNTQPCFSLPGGQGLHCAQLSFTLPWGQGLQTAHLLFRLP